MNLLFRPRGFLNGIVGAWNFGLVLLFFGVGHVFVCLAPSFGGEERVRAVAIAMRDDMWHYLTGQKIADWVERQD
jgi:hypothetical protein